MSDKEQHDTSDLRTKELVHVLETFISQTVMDYHAFRSMQMLVANSNETNEAQKKWESSLNSLNIVIQEIETRLIAGEHLQGIFATIAAL